MATTDLMSAAPTSLSNASLIPNPVPDFTPSALIKITWPSGAEALLGNSIDAAEMAEEPSVEIFPTDVPNWEADHSAEETKKETTYTLAMFDPDAPSREDPKFGSFRHWVITGLKLPAASVDQTTRQGALASQPAITPYRAPAPGPGTGDHRYVFLLYQEPSAGVNVALDAPERGGEKEQRRSWNATAFAKQYNLKLVSANFFVCRVD